MNQPITIKKHFKATPEQIWNALTRDSEMKKWYFDIPGFQPLVGYTFSFTGGPDDRLYKHICTVTKVDTNRVLAHTWTYEGYDGETVVEWQLEPDGDGTFLKLTHSGLDTFPATNPDFAEKNFREGWQHIINVSLAAYLSD